MDKYVTPTAALKTPSDSERAPAQISCMAYSSNFTLIERLMHPPRSLSANEKAVVVYHLNGHTGITLRDPSLREEGIRPETHHM